MTVAADQFADIFKLTFLKRFNLIPNTNPIHYFLHFI